MYPFLVLCLREFKRIIRLWQQTILPPAITSTLYFVIFGNIVGSRISSVGGMPFVMFIAPGLILMAVMMQSYSNVCSVVYLDKFQKSVEEILVSPIRTPLMLLGYVSGGVLRGLLAGLVVFIVAELFLDATIAHPLLMICVFLLTSTLFSFMGLINGLLANSFDHTMIVPTFILTPLIYLGGVFYNVDMLPDFWQPIIQINPIFHLVSMFRFSFYGGVDLNFLHESFLLILFIAAGYGASYYILEKTTCIRK